MTHHILVVDDETDVETLISLKFRREIREGKYRFSFARNGVEAYIQCAETTDVEMVLTDINMPVMDGLALLTQLNALEHPPKTVVVSAYSDLSNIRQAMNNGAFDFVTKPINSQDLILTIERTLKTVAKEKENQARLNQAQMQLVQNEKMSSLGQMVAGVAHEINNPVNFIYGNLSHAKAYMQDLVTLINLYRQDCPEPSTKVKDQLEEIDLEFLQEDLTKLFDSLNIGAERIRELVLSLRNFSRLDESESKSADIHEGIESTLTMLSHRLKATSTRPEIEVIRAFEKLPMVDCYPSQLNQVIMNLLANAIDALDEYSEGRTVQEIQTQPNKIWIKTAVVEEQWVRIAISDNGPGMDETTRAQLFNPFFTTKPIGQGTGLGLSISYQIVVEKHGGRLLCESTVGTGTHFLVDIPIPSLQLDSRELDHTGL